MMILTIKLKVSSLKIPYKKCFLPDARSLSTGSKFSYDVNGKILIPKDKIERGDKMIKRKKYMLEKPCLGKQTSNATKG